MHNVFFIVALVSLAFFYLIGLFNYVCDLQAKEKENTSYVIMTLQAILPAVILVILFQLFY